MAIFNLQEQSGTTNITRSENQVQNQNGSQQAGLSNSFNPGQLALQNQLGGYASSMLQGQLPPGFMKPNDAVAQWANYNFDRYELPRIYSQYGTGSPVASGRRQEMNLGLAAQAAQQAQSGSLNAFNQAWQYATRPMGQNTTGTQLGTTTNNTQQTGTELKTINGRTIDLGELLNIVLPNMAGVMPAGIFSP